MGAVTERLINVIKDFENPFREGFKADGTVVPYWDKNGYAIGWGNRNLLNGAIVTANTRITEGEAEILVLNKTNEYAAAVDRAITASISQNQFEALVSLCYNIGIGAFSGSTLVKVINATPGNIDAIAAEFRKWIWVTENGVKKQSDALKVRREKEITLYAGAVAGVSAVAIVVAFIALYILKKKKII